MFFLDMWSWFEKKIIRSVKHELQFCKLKKNKNRNTYVYMFFTISQSFSEKYLSLWTLSRRNCYGPYGK